MKIIRRICRILTAPKRHFEHRKWKRAQDEAMKSLKQGRFFLDNHDGHVANKIDWDNYLANRDRIHAELEGPWLAKAAKARQEKARKDNARWQSSTARHAHRLRGTSLWAHMVHAFYKWRWVPVLKKDAKFDLKFERVDGQYTSVRVTRKCTMRDRLGILEPYVHEDGRYGGGYKFSVETLPTADLCQWFLDNDAVKEQLAIVEEKKRKDKEWAIGYRERNGQTVGDGTMDIRPKKETPA